MVGRPEAEDNLVVYIVRFVVMFAAKGLNRSLNIVVVSLTDIASVLEVMLEAMLHSRGSCSMVFEQTVDSVGLVDTRYCAHLNHSESSAVLVEC